MLKNAPEFTKITIGEIIEIIEISSWFCELTELIFVMIPYISSTGYPLKTQGIMGHVQVANSSSAHSPVVSRGGGAFAILLRPGSWALAYPVANPGFLTHVFLKVSWRNSSAKTRRLLKIG